MNITEIDNIKVEPLQEDNIVCYVCGKPALSGKVVIVKEMDKTGEHYKAVIRCHNCFAPKNEVCYQRIKVNASYR